MSPRRKPPVGIALLLAALVCALPLEPILVRVQAAITVSELLAEDDTSNVSSYTSAGTLQCASSALCLCFTASSDTAGPDTPTLTGGGQTTWTHVLAQGFNTVASPAMTINVFRTLGEAGTAAAMVANFGADNQTYNSFHCWQFTGVDTSGTNGSGAVTQCDGFAADNIASSTIAPDGLAALQATNALIQIAHLNSETQTWTAQMSFTSGTADIDDTTPGQEARVQYMVNATDATPTWTWSPSATSEGGTIACEIKEASAGGTSGAPNLLLLGVGD